ncbi:MAG: ABC transporter substrate-binding protein [Alphaproteobacteria bacterium]
MPRRLVLAALAILAVASATAQEPRRGGTMTVALTADIRGVEPGIPDANTDNIIHQIFEGLVAFRADLTVGPALAENWATEDDGRTYRFRLRPDVRFHNGAALTADDYVWTWNRLQKLPSWPCRGDFNGSQATKVVAVEAPDPATVLYRLEQPAGLFLKQIANVACHAVAAHRDSADAEGKWRTPIGTGPLVFKEWRRGEYVTLERFADYRASPAPSSGYAGARPMHVDRVQFRVIPDQAAAEAALLAGQVDVVPFLGPDRIADMKRRGMGIIATPGLGWSAILLNKKDPLLANPVMRRALAHAIDIDALAEATSDGLLKANPSGVSEVSPYFDESLRAWPKYDPDRARALLKEAGYAGQTLRIQANRQYPMSHDHAVLMQAMLTAVGVKAEMEVLEWAAMLSSFYKEGYQILSWIQSPRLDPSLQYASFLADKAKMAWATWNDAGALALLQESVVSADEARRRRIFHALHALMQEQLPILPIRFSLIVQGVHPSLKGYTAWPGARTITWNAWKDAP